MDGGAVIIDQIDPSAAALRRKQGKAGAGTTVIHRAKADPRALAFNLFHARA
jgi:hypothetical protein